MITPALAGCNSVPSAFSFHLHGLIGVKAEGGSWREVSGRGRSHLAVVRGGVVGGMAPLTHVQPRLLLYPPLLPVGRRLVQRWREVGRGRLSPLTAVVTRIVLLLLLLLLPGGDEILSIVVILQVSTSTSTLLDTIQNISPISQYLVIMIISYFCCDFNKKCLKTQYHHK